MFKKSFLVVLIQVFGAILGLVSLYLIAGDMAPEVYSLVGVYAILSNITLTFSDLGIETTMMREALLWKSKGDNNRISEYATQALMSRIMAFFLMLPALLVYVMYLNFYKYDGQYTYILLVFLIGAELNSLNNAMSLIVRARGGYVFAQFTSTLNNYVIKFAGIGVYYMFGAEAYLVFYGVSSVPLAIIYFVKLSPVIRLKNIKFKLMLSKIWDARYLWLKTDLDYFKNNADSILVSTIFPAAIMGSYSVYKQLEQLSKSVIEGFFDVLSQHSVKYKGNPSELKSYEKKYKKARNVMMLMIVIILSVFVINPNFFVEITHLTRYEGISNMIICIAIVSMVHLAGKYEINALAFFGTSKMNFGLGIVTFIISVISYGVVILFPTLNGVLLQRVIIFGVMSFFSIVIFNRERESLYSEILR